MLNNNGRFLNYKIQNLQEKYIPPNKAKLTNNRMLWLTKEMKTKVHVRKTVFKKYRI